MIWTLGRAHGAGERRSRPGGGRRADRGPRRPGGQVRLPRRRAGRAAGLGVLALAMINIAAMVSPRNLPLIAEYGWSLIFFVLLAVVMFLVPVSLAIAELATAWPRRGGVYPWVREAFRGRMGFLAVLVRLGREPGVVPDRARLHGGQLRLRLRPHARERQRLPGRRHARGVLGRDAARVPGRRCDERRRLDRDDPRRDRARRPDHRAGRLVPRRRQRVPDPLLGRRPGAGPGPDQPGLPDRRRADVRRHGGGGLPRRQGARPGAQLPARDPAGRRGHDRVHDPGLARPGRGRAPARHQPGRRGHAGVRRDATTRWASGGC